MMLRRSPLNKVGKSPLRESTLSPDDERLLQIFWAKVSRYTREGQQYKILELLKTYAEIEGSQAASRNHFNRIKRRFKIAGLTCLVCTNDAMNRHHVLELRKGGGNCKANIVALCDE